MKAIKFFVSLLLAGSVGSVSAQFVNTAGGSSTASSVRNVDTNGWSRVYLSYNLIGLNYDGKSNDYYEDLGLNGVQVGYLKGFSISKQYPIFVETGIGFQWAFKSMDLEDYDDMTGFPADDNDRIPSKSDFDITHKYNLFSLQVPVNFVYKHTFNNGVSVAPYVGVDLKYHISGKLTQKLDAKDEYAEELLEDMDDSKGLDLFDKKDMGDKDNMLKHFQIGWHIGVGLNAKSFFASISYGSDFNEIMKKCKPSTTSFTVGYNF